ncbi:hypothetical protein PSAL108031_12125 [Ectopseudomonas alcaliphila]
MQPANRPHPGQGPCSAQALPLQLARWWWQRTNNPRHPSPGSARSGGARLGCGSRRSKLPLAMTGRVAIVHAMEPPRQVVHTPADLWWRGRQHRAPGLWRPPLQRRPGNRAPHGAFFLSGSRNLFRLRRENVIKRAVSTESVERSHNGTTLGEARHTPARLIITNAPLRPAKLINKGQLRDTSSSADLGNAIHLAASSWYGRKRNNDSLFLQHV